MTSRPLKDAARHVHHSTMKGSTRLRADFRKLHEIVVGARLEEAAYAVEHVVREEGADRLHCAAGAGERPCGGLGGGAHFGIDWQAYAHVREEADAQPRRLELFDVRGEVMILDAAGS